MPDPYLSQRALPHYVQRTVGQLRAVPDLDAAPGPSPLRLARVAADAPRARDAAPAALRRLDSSGRLNIKALCDVLGWNADTLVVLRPAALGYVATATDHDGGRRSLTGRVDREGRLRLPASVSEALDPAECHQVLSRVRGDALELYPAAIVDDLLDALLAQPTGPSALAAVPERKPT